VILIKDESEKPPSARRFVTLRASENNVMRKLEVHGLLAWRPEYASRIFFRQNNRYKQAFPLKSGKACLLHASAFSIQHSAFSIQHSAFSIQHSAL